jgi:hypothetical protein
LENKNKNKLTESVTFSAGNNNSFGPVTPEKKERQLISQSFMKDGVKEI